MPGDAENLLWSSNAGIKKSSVSEMGLITV